MARAAPVLVALATYNEIENLPSLVEAIHRELPAADLLVIDDNSPDGTGRWCDEFAAVNPWFTCLHRPGKLGLGSALAAAIQIAIERQYRFLVTLDADWSHPPECLPQLVAAAEHAEVVLGSRYCPGGRVEGWPMLRRWVSRANNWLSHHLAGIPVRDSSGNLRAYDVAALAKLDRDQLQAAGYSFLEETLWRFHRAGARFVEVPFVFTNRRAGESKVNPGEVWGKVRTLGRLTWRRIWR